MQLVPSLMTPPGAAALSQADYGSKEAVSSTRRPKELLLLLRTWQTPSIHPSCYIMVSMIVDNSRHLQISRMTMHPSFDSGHQGGQIGDHMKQSYPRKAGKASQERDARLPRHLPCPISEAIQGIHWVQVGTVPCVGGGISADNLYKVILKAGISMLSAASCFLDCFLGAG